MKLVLIGAGQRGRIYADAALQRGLAEIAAVAEPNEERRESARRALGIPAERCYASAQDLWAQGKLADAAVIASMDRDHYAQAMAALDLGYDILLEKPISPDPLECMAIAKKAERLGRKVVVCHVLRYTPFYSTLKQILDSGELGKIISIQHNENIGNFHIAHSFVRGNWRRADQASPMILQKSCHDMDLMTWLADSEAKQIVSFGDLRYFRPENAPEGAALRCCDCPSRDSCHYSAYRAYLPIRGTWPATVVCQDQSEAGLRKALETSPYGRCVFHCDNDVCDNQVALIRFHNNVTVSFHLSGFTDRMCRTIKVMCERGEIRGHDGDNLLEIIPFAANQTDKTEKRVIRTQVPVGGHGGGDYGLLEDFFRILREPGQGSRSSIGRSIESHILSCAAEESRLTHTVIDLDDYKARLEARL